MWWQKAKTSEYEFTYKSSFRNRIDVIVIAVLEDFPADQRMSVLVCELSSAPSRLSAIRRKSFAFISASLLVQFMAFGCSIAKIVGEQQRTRVEIIDPRRSFHLTCFISQLE